MVAGSGCGDGAVGAGLWSALAAGFAVFFWWSLLRVRLEVGPDGIVAVNPWGTQRLRLDEVASLRLGAWGRSSIILTASRPRPVR
ncbi:PH domain-containing protein [Streptomyces sp. NPDC050516]|uniref:PH domain-containing protein n=1 Tax=Streptomyces sp. NPDC050516 TaxID=3365621 RepID=UPI0037B89D55